MRRRLSGLYSGVTAGAGDVKPSVLRGVTWICSGLNCCAGPDDFPACACRGAWICSGPRAAATGFCRVDAAACSDGFAASADVVAARQTAVSAALVQYLIT